MILFVKSRNDHKNEPTYYFIFEQPANPFLDGYAAQSGAMAMAPNWLFPLKYVLQNELCRYIFLKESYASKTFEFIMHTLCRMVRSTMG